MPKITIPSVVKTKPVLQSSKWYLLQYLNEPNQRLILCLGPLPIWTRPSADGMMIYDPEKNTIENVPEGKNFSAMEVEIEINVV